MKRLLLTLLIGLTIYGYIPCPALAQSYKKQVIGSNGRYKGWDYINDTLTISATSIFLPTYETADGAVFKFNAILTAGTDSFTLYAKTSEDLQVGYKPVGSDTLYLALVDSFKVTTAGMYIWQIDTAFTAQCGYPRGSVYDIEIVNRGATTGSKITRGILRTTER